MAYINYQPSAAEAVANVFQLKQMEDTNNQNRRNLIYQGIKDAGATIASVIGYNKRKAAIQYLGDDKLAEMESKLAELQQELTTVQNQMRTIRAEDKNSLDVATYPGSVPAEIDVNTMPVSGRRTMSVQHESKDTYDAGPANYPYRNYIGAKALGGV